MRGLAFLHVFPFSARPGTPAAKMPPVKSGLIKERAKRLREKGAEVLTQHLASLVGTEQDVLVERGGIARTPCFTPVYVGEAYAAGSLARVKINGQDGAKLSS